MGHYGPEGVVGALFTRWGRSSRSGTMAPALHLAVFDEAPAVPVVMRLLLAGGPMLRDAPDASGKTPLMVGAKFGHTEAANALLAGGAECVRCRTATRNGADSRSQGRLRQPCRRAAQSMVPVLTTRLTRVARVVERGQLLTWSDCYCAVGPIHGSPMNTIARLPGCPGR